MKNLEKNNIKDFASKSFSKLRTTGFFNVFGANVINKLLSVVLSFVLVRILSKAEYGVYTYAYNVASFFIMLNGLGACSAVLQLCSELFEEKLKSFHMFLYGRKVGIVVDVLLGIAIAITALFAPLAITGSNSILFLYCLYPLVTFLYEIKITRLRTLLMNKEFGYALNMQSILNVILSIGGAFLFQVAGLVIGQMGSYLISFIVLSLLYSEKNEALVIAQSNTEHSRLNTQEKRDYWSVAIVSCFNSCLSSILAPFCVFALGLFHPSDETVANYQVATLIPSGLLFVTMTIMTYVYPYFAKNRNDYHWSKKYSCLLFAGCFALNGVISILVIAFAHPIITLFFGQQYESIVPIFIILIVSYLIQSTFRIPAGNLLVTQRKLLDNTIVNVFGIIINVLACLILIPGIGIYGAAFTQLITIVITSALYVILYFHALKSVRTS